MIVLYMDKIKVEILNKQKRVPLESSFLTLKFTNTPYHFVNSIRRLLYNDIPTYAFSDINIQINTSKAYHNDIINLTVKSSGSCTEIDLLKRACLIAIYKLDQIKKQIEDEYNGNKSKDIEIYIENADETLINPLNYIIQSYKEIKFSGMSKPTMLESTMKLSIVANEGSAINYVYNAIDELKKVYNYLENAI